MTITIPIENQLKLQSIGNILFPSPHAGGLNNINKSNINSNNNKNNNSLTEIATRNLLIIIREGGSN